jgi:hypothetical protein
MSKAIKYAEQAVVYAAKGAWVVFERLNRISPNPGFTPKWSDKPLLKSWEKEKPPLGWPYHGLALSQVRTRDSQADSGWQAAHGSPAQ